MSKYGSIWLARLAVPGVVSLIAFLSYSSQYLFRAIDPGPLSRAQSIRFNVLLACIWISYARTCLTDPGRVPEGWQSDDDDGSDEAEMRQQRTRTRHCKKCDSVKPPRSHHCKICQRCIPKMDHHCPWTSNCVSHFTFPHFMRFLFFAVTAMCYLEHFLYIRAASIWEDRNEAASLGPSVTQLVHLFMLICTNSLTLLMVGIMLSKGIYSLATNVMTIESWELERHEQLLRRARVLGGYLDGPGGVRTKIERHEYPYDVGIWQNMRDGMGTSNVLAWFWPLAATPCTNGLSFETNGFEEPGQTWPPPDPDRMPRPPRSAEQLQEKTALDKALNDADVINAFKARQQADLQRRGLMKGAIRRKPFHQRFDQDGYPAGDGYLPEDDHDHDGEEGWQDSGGNRLQDYGVEEDVEFYDEDDIPLSELLKRRQQRQVND